MVLGVVARAALVAAEVGRLLSWGLTVLMCQLIRHSLGVVQVQPAAALSALCTL